MNLENYSIYNLLLILYFCYLNAMVKKRIELFSVITDFDFSLGCMYLYVTNIFKLFIAYT